MNIRQLLERLPDLPCVPALQWADTLPATTTPEAAYAACAEPVWMVWLGCIVDLPPTILVSAVLRVLRETCPHLAQFDSALREALDDLDAWVVVGGTSFASRPAITPLTILASEVATWNAAVTPALVLSELVDVMSPPPEGEVWAEPRDWINASLTTAMAKLCQVETRRAVLAERLRAALPWTAIEGAFLEALRPADPVEERAPR